MPQNDNDDGWIATLRTKTFRALQHRNYRVYFFGQIVSFTGSWMQSAALLWLVYEKTEDPLWPPLMLVAQTGPTLLFGPLGGWLADRFRKKRLILGTQCLYLLSASMFTASVPLGWTDPYWLLCLAFLNGLIQSIDIPARLAFVPDLVPKVDLINAIALNSLLFNAARAVGPAVSGLLFLLAASLPESSWKPTEVGAFACFGLNAISYIAVLFALIAIRVPGSSGPRVKHPIAEGLKFVWSRKPLLAILIFTGFISAFGWPTLTLFPPYTRTVLQHAEKEYSWLVSAMGLGALIAALFNATYGTLSRARVFASTGAILTAVAILGLSLTDRMPFAVLSAGLFGFGMILYLSTGQFVLQMSVPDELRGRVMALWPMALGGSAMIGHLASGQLARMIPLKDLMMALAGGVGLTAVGVVLVSRRLARR